MFLPIVKRIDLSVSQDIFHVFGGHEHSGQIRLDITNFGNLLNDNWGVGQRLVQNQILTNARGRRPGPRDLPHGGREQRAADHVVPDDDVRDRRLHADVELPLQLQLTGGVRP